MDGAPVASRSDTTEASVHKGGFAREASMECESGQMRGETDLSGTGEEDRSRESSQI